MNTLEVFAARCAPIVVVRVEREGAAWLVVHRNRKHGWLHASLRDAIADARIVACGFGAAVVITNQDGRPR